MYQISSSVSLSPYTKGLDRKFFPSGKFETEVKQLEERLGKINYVEGTSERLANDQRQLRWANL
jgi:hypothetical protein